ncbi:MAG: prolipoprotein diacylglyceryl transferase [Tepidiphilus sp.]|jgi:phosphatidylglycerol:prolipoprotein diacylglycerol transferase|nr:prolipoprotein diacylglyceryl transferase [Tepidiphilus sp.]
MLVHPQFDPVAFSLGPLSVRWYGLMYLAGFLAFLWLAPRHARRMGDVRWTRERLDALLFYGVLGVVLGGRLGEVLFYQPQYYFAHPLEIFAIWRGGMSFHGGLVGAIVAMLLFARREGMGFWQVADFVAPLVPPGLGFGRLGNFINGELWGRPAPESLPWAMIYPQVDTLPRHPSQLYEALGEGLLLFVLLWWYAGRPRPTGRVAAVFLMGYGAIRFVCECFRTPDPGILSWLTPALSTAQWLSLAMLLAGAVLYLYARQRPDSSFSSTQG